MKFEDGARVKQGDVLFVLDSRTIEAQMAQVEGNIARDQAQIEGAERDIRRYTELVAKSATRSSTWTTPRPRQASSRAPLKADKAALENLKVQLSYCTIRAPISGRISMASVKVGNIARQADVTPLATIIQIAPIYVSFTVPQRSLPDVRAAIAAETASLVGGHAGQRRARDRPGHDDREHGRSGDRHGHHPRHHAERERGAVAGHAGQHAR